MPIAEITELSRKRYAHRKEEVEDEINRWASGSGMGEMASAVEETPRPIESRAGKGDLYPIICSNCGKEGKAPFKPSPDRPVYCSDCLEKIQKGEIQPVKGYARAQSQLRKKEAEDQATLADIGIEFAGYESRASGPGRGATVPKQTAVVEKAPPIVQKSELVTPKSISLKDLKPIDKSPKLKEKTGPDIESLRNAIQSALKSK